MDCSLPGSSIHGIFQARVLEWGAIAFSKVITQYSSFCVWLISLYVMSSKVKPNEFLRKHKTLWSLDHSTAFLLSPSSFADLPTMNLLQSCQSDL